MGDIQRGFFDDEHKRDLEIKHSGAVEPVDPNADEADKPRLRGHNAAILARLQAGPATNDELARICLRYSARIHDLRKHGYAISSRNVGGGQWVFWME